MTQSTFFRGVKVCEGHYRLVRVSDGRPVGPLYRSEQELRNDLGRMLRQLCECKTRRVG